MSVNSRQSEGTRNASTTQWSQSSEVDPNVYPYRTRPDQVNEVEMGYIFTVGATVDAGTFMDDSVNPNVAWHSHGVDACPRHHESGRQAMRGQGGVPQ